MTKATDETAREPRVVVGVDGSDGSLKALEWGVHEARRKGVALHVLCCYSVPFYGEPGMFGAYGIESQVEAIKADHEQILATALARAAVVDATVPAEGSVVFASPVMALSEDAKPGDVIVVGSTGRGGALADALGSVATALCHRATVPVVVVPANRQGDVTNDTTSVPKGVTMKKIVVGIDGSPTSEEALRWAFDEAKLAGAELVVLHGWSYPYPLWRAEADGPRDEMKLDALRQLEASIDSLGTRSGEGEITVHARLVEEGAAKALIDEAADADLVVVGSRGRGGFASLLLGSVSRAVVQHAPCPVAVIRHQSA